MSAQTPTSSKLWLWAVIALVLVGTVATLAYYRLLPTGGTSHGDAMLIELLREGPEFEVRLDPLEVDERLPYLRQALAEVTRERGASFSHARAVEIMDFLQEKAGPGKEWRFFELDGRHYSVDF
jgi:hypothetical protein